MPRTLSAAARAVLHAEHTGDAAIHLVTLEHDRLGGTPIRLCDDRVSHVSRGNTFTAFPFSVVLPDQREDLSSVGQIVFDNVDRSISAWLRTLVDSPRLLLEVALSSDLDTPILTFPRLTWQAVSFPVDSPVFSAELVFEDVSQAQWPDESFTPASDPGVFA